MNCPDCGADVQPESLFCPHCGVRLGTVELSQEAEDTPAEEAKSEAARRPAPTQEATPPPAAPQPPAPQAPSPRDRFTQAAAAEVDDEAESTEEMWSGYYSAKAMYGTWVLGVIITVVLFAALIYWFSSILHALGMALGLSLIWWVLLGLVYAYRRLNVYYELTRQRFIHKRGILRRVTDRIEIIDIDDVIFTQGLVQRMLSVGTIKLISSDRTHPELMMYGIENVDRVAGLIDDLRRAERRKRGLHIEAI